MSASLSFPRVLALVGGLGVVAAFFMPWFSTQGLLLSGQFLHNFLASASPSDLRRFLPTSSPEEIQLLRMLVDLFPASGAVAAGASLYGGLRGGRSIANAILGVAGVLPLIAWVIGIRQLPPGASAEIGLWLIGLGSLAVLLGLAIELLVSRHQGKAQR